MYRCICICICILYEQTKAFANNFDESWIGPPHPGPIRIHLLRNIASFSVQVFLAVGGRDMAPVLDVVVFFLGMNGHTDLISENLYRNDRFC